MWRYGTRKSQTKSQTKPLPGWLTESMRSKIRLWFLLSAQMVTVGTPPPDDTWHAFLSGSASSGSPQEDTWHASPIRTPLGRDTRHSQTSHPDDRHITFGRSTYPIRICFSGSLTKVSKSYYVIPTACHGPRSAACRAKG
ncbi:hypothetical protein CK203_048714 [Vitis vinifera]|uniref:Uncharacterized protein n=1 Tax=Vitis vinifera TaxID=29760 RepID=A0A438GDS3_VITVI|nr:hypothetical protein CK203_048714 [Vitis vinifera]